MVGVNITEITEKTENDTVGRYRFRLNLDSTFYVRKQIFEPRAKVGAALVWNLWENQNFLKIKTKRNNHIQ